MLRNFAIIFAAVLMTALFGCDAVGVTPDEYYQQRSNDAFYHNLGESTNFGTGGSHPNYVPAPIP